MLRVSIVDGFCPRAYDHRSLTTEPMGGTESAVVLLAEALAGNACVEVIQHCRTDSCTSPGNVRYRGRIGNDWRTEASMARRDVTIIINSPKLMALWRRKDPGCQIILWRHNFLSNRHRRLFDELEQFDTRMVCVSRFHQMDSRRAQRGFMTSDRTSFIPNPVQVYHQRQVQRNPNHLLFCSSPHKGLEQVIERFDEVRRQIPELQLRICNPGYLRDPVVKNSGIVVLGALTRPQLHTEMARALCVFYPQTRFRETFGLVGAEANALGTPVLAPAGMGALSEVLGGREQLLRSIDTAAILNQLEKWRSGLTPPVHGRSEFDPQSVARHWMTLMGRRDTDKSSRTTTVQKHHRAVAEPGEA
ncbi:glycosyltransferase family 4 protein [Granulosicoccus sp. 3-233]|uniref:glycosyltransferase family 4 protein n=1 Tax=Granulosicoccus sp. 3-233 TaxID=3417969 RepID=UPI003D3352DC